MTTLKKYAALSAYVYNDQRGGANNQTPLNRLQLPSGWVELKNTATGFPAQTQYDDNFFSFTAGAYVDQSTGEIVISYKGTDLLTSFEGRSWNTVGDIATDLAAGVGSYVSTLQFTQAATYYQEVKKWAALNGHDASKISFTGHSLGGGIASVMSVWFNRPATTFAEAPFEATAQSSGVLAIVGAAIALKGFSDTDFNAYAPTAALGTASAVFQARQALVTNYYNQGEFLNYIRTDSGTVFNTNNPIDIGNQPVSIALAMHSMNLHAAFLYDDRLRELAKAMPELVPALIDTKLFAADPNSRTKDLMTTLVNDQIRIGFDADSALNRFTTDMDKLKGTDGIAVNQTMRKALIAVAMEYHYEAEPATSHSFFSLNSGAINFNLSDIGATSLKSLPLLSMAASSTTVGGDPFHMPPLNAASSWHVQIGTGVMTWTASVEATDVALGGAGADIIDAGAGDDILIGGAGTDSLKGGAGTDDLIGGEGDDTLNGGSGGDLLHGGAGNDTYQLTSGGDLIISKGSSPDTVTINNFGLIAATTEGRAGHLGIKLDPTQRVALAQDDGTNVGASSANFWAAPDYDANNLQGQSSDMLEGNGAGFHIYLAQGAHAGDTITLALVSELAAEFQARKRPFKVRTPEQRSCFKKHSGFRNKYACYGHISHIRISDSPRCTSSLALSLQRATRKAVTQ